MRWREFLFKNLWWKLLSFALAVMIWSGAQNVEVRSISTPLLPPFERSFHDLPIRVLAPPGLAGPVRLDPPTAQIDVTGEETLVKRLGASDPLVFVEITGDIGSETVTNRISVRLPAGVTLIHLIPESVGISRPFDE